MGEASSMIVQEVVAGDLACARCGYNLRTLNVQRGVCPECGLGVQAALELGRALREVRFGRLAAGAGILALAALMAVVHQLCLPDDSNATLRWLGEWLPWVRALSFPVVL